MTKNMPVRPDNKDQRINPVYIIAWCAFLLVPALALYTGWQHHSLVAVIASLLALAGFITLIIIAIRHNIKVDNRSEEP